jgi:hypothetical protein
MSYNELIVASHELNISLIGYSLGLSNDEFSIDLIDYPSVRQLLIDYPELMQTCVNGFYDAKQ